MFKCYVNWPLTLNLEMYLKIDQNTVSKSDLERVLSDILVINEVNGNSYSLSIRESPLVKFTQ